MQILKNYIDQSAKQLMLRVFKTHPSRSILNIFAEGVLEGEGIIVNAFVIGTSHAVFMTCGEHRIAEIFSCDKRVDQTPCFQRDLNSLYEPVQMNLEGIDYQFKSECKTIVSIEKWFEENMQDHGDANRIVVSYQFPDIGVGTAPATTVTAGMLNGGVYWETAHTYPNENCIVFTRTDLNILNRGRDSVCSN